MKKKGLNRREKIKRGQIGKKRSHETGGGGWCPAPIRQEKRWDFGKQEGSEMGGGRPYGGKNGVGGELTKSCCFHIRRRKGNKQGSIQLLTLKKKEKKRMRISNGASSEKNERKNEGGGPQTWGASKKRNQKRVGGQLACLLQVNSREGGMKIVVMGGDQANSSGAKGEKKR